MTDGIKLSSERFLTKWNDQQEVTHIKYLMTHHGTLKVEYL